MSIINLIPYLFELIRAYPQEHPIAFRILIGIYVVLSIWIIVVNVRALRGRMNVVAAVLYSLIRAAALVLTGFVFFVADGEGELSTNALNTRFYIETIVATILYSGIFIVTFARDSGEQDDNQPDEEEPLGVLGKLLLLIILSVVFLFTNLEWWLVDFGPFIWKHTLGGWVITGYLAWALWVMLSILQEAVLFLIRIVLPSPAGKKK